MNVGHKCKIVTKGNVIARMASSRESVPLEKECGEGECDEEGDFQHSSV